MLAMYAAAAYIILEVSDIVLPRLGLPEGTVTILIILLIGGFPVILVLSWVFDITPEGIRKTESLGETKEEEIPAPIQKRRLRASDLIIGLLFLVVCILLYPRIFQRDQFEELRNEDGRISVSVMPFENLTGEPIYDVWERGFQNLLISTLSGSAELQVRQFQTITGLLDQTADPAQAAITPSLARDLAAKLESSTYVLGKIYKGGDLIRINTQLVNAETEEVFKTFQGEGRSEEDLFLVVDSLSNRVINYLEIQKIKHEFRSPEIAGLTLTSSAEAFRYFMHAWESFSVMDLPTTEAFLLRAMEADSGFAAAYVFCSFVYNTGNQIELAKEMCNKAYTLRAQLPVREQLFVDQLHAYYYEHPEKQITICKQILELDEFNTTYMHMMALAHFSLNQFEVAVQIWEKALDLHTQWGTYMPIPLFYLHLGDSYHHLGEYQKEKVLYELGLKVIPGYLHIIRRQLTCALSMNDTLAFRNHLSQLQQSGTAQHLSESYILSRIGFAYESAGQIEPAVKYLTQALELDPGNPEAMNNLAWTLIDHDRDIPYGVELASRSLELDPGNWMTLDTKGWGLYKQGKYKEAQALLERSWNSRHFFLQDIYDRLQLAENAIAE